MFSRHLFSQKPCKVPQKYRNRQIIHRLSQYTGVCDIVFWMEIGDFENWEGADFEDQPENTVVTEPYMSVPLWWAVLADSPVVNVYRDQ